MQLRNFSLCKFLGFLTLLVNQAAIAYVPASLKDKYKLGELDSIFRDFYCDFWMPTMANNYGSEAAVRESFAPSAMVDTNGDLYAISLWDFDSVGPGFLIEKLYNKSETSSPFISSIYFCFLPWNNIPGVTPNCATTPYLSSMDCDPDLFKNYIHNIFMPCLAQEVDEDKGSEYLYGFVCIPPTRFISAQTQNREGMLFFKLKKDGLSTLETTFIYASEYPCFQYSYLFPRWVRHGDIKDVFLQPCYGNFRACCIGDEIHLYHLGNLKESLGSHDICHSVFSKDGTCERSSFPITSMFSPVINPKFEKCGDEFYFMCNTNGYVPKLLRQKRSGELQEKINSVWAYLYLDTLGGWSYSQYNFDFLVLDGVDKKNKIWCILGFQGQNKYSGLTATEGWSSTYCHGFSPENASLFIWSFPITNDDNIYYIEDAADKSKPKFNKITGSSTAYSAYPEYIQNVIYTTECGSNSALKPQDKQETGDKNKRLYLNTQKMCTYKNYIIYAYCYPGKSNGKGNHLYIGYAPYVITANAQLRLLTKTEFKDADDNSFITDCSRIISLDCKNGHVWLTYMAKDGNGVENADYKYFYIKASDLVGE